jgi:hypothetical protein
MDRAQRDVLVGMAAALAAAAIILIMAVIFGGRGFAAGASPELRARLLAASVLAPAIALLICIARLAKHRFFTPDDINGSALTKGTARAMLLQALLQNTLEQLGLASLVYVSCSFIYPARFLGAIPAAAVMFFVGRILFFAGYSGGAPSRAFGFGLTFYPTVLLASAAVLFLVTNGAA